MGRGFVMFGYKFTKSYVIVCGGYVINPSFISLGILPSPLSFFAGVFHMIYMRRRHTERNFFIRFFKMEKIMVFGNACKGLIEG
jgi:hypothetical protein